MIAARRQRLVTLVLLLMSLINLVVTGCGSLTGAGVAQAASPRQAARDVPAADLAAVAAANNAFAFDLYRLVGQRNGNVIYSPTSISLTLAMTHAGARTATERQMAEALRFTLPQERLHPAFNALDQALASRSDGDAGLLTWVSKSQPALQLRIANALWGQTGRTFRPEFLDVLARHYGAGIRLVDFTKAPSEARRTINAWVSDRTDGRIRELVPEGAITPEQGLMLTNAVYFKADWRYQFERSATRAEAFHLLDGTNVITPMMRLAGAQPLNYAAGDGYQAVELPYRGSKGTSQVTMVILVPDTGRFESFEQTLEAERVSAIVRSLSSRPVVLSMPKFTFDSPSFSLKEMLGALGMREAFDQQRADFSGMAELGAEERLVIADVLHQARVAVDEQGTEAAAATGARSVFQAISLPPPPLVLKIDRPFIFLIRDVDTGAFLFVGRVTNPKA